MHLWTAMAESESDVRGAGRERLDPSTSLSGDLKESFYLALDGGQSYPGPLERGRGRERVAAFLGSCKRVVDTILVGFARALELEDAFFFAANHNGALDRLRLIHYPPAPVAVAGAEQDAGSGSIRAGSHSDYVSVVSQ